MPNNAYYIALLLQSCSKSLFLLSEKGEFLLSEKCLEVLGRAQEWDKFG